MTNPLAEVKVVSKSPPDAYIQLGTLGKPYQLEGGLRFYALGAAEAEALTSLNTVFVDGVGEMALRRVKAVGKYTVIYLSRALTLETARKLVNRDLYAAPDALPEPTEGELYIAELLGMRVYLEGEPYGEVAELLNAGLQDLLLVELEAARRVMLPLQAPYVSVRGDGVYLENVPEGLLELGQA